MAKHSNEPYKETWLIAPRNSESRRRQESVHNDPYDLSKNKDANKVLWKKGGVSLILVRWLLEASDQRLRKAINVSLSRIALDSQWIKYIGGSILCLELWEMPRATKDHWDSFYFNA